MSEFINALRVAFEAKANPGNAARQKAYMRHKFEFFGLGSESIKDLRKQFLKENSLPDQSQINEIILEMWQQPEREFQYFAMILLEKYLKKADENIIELLEYMVVNKSWWDTIDMIAARLAGGYFKRFPEKIPVITEKWMASGNFWLQRTCLLFQLKYKAATDDVLLFDLIKRLSGENEFFIRKAIGWALREYSKTNPAVVIQFVESNQLKPLSRKEALKVILRRSVE